MKLAIVFDVDPDLGPDPLDEHKMPRRQGEFIDDNADVLLVWREYGDQFEDGFRTHVIGQGVWENVTLEQVQDAIAHVSALPDEAES